MAPAELLKKVEGPGMQEFEIQLYCKLLRSTQCLLVLIQYCEEYTC